MDFTLYWFMFPVSIVVAMLATDILRSRVPVEKAVTEQRLVLRREGMPMAMAAVAWTKFADTGMTIGALL